MKTTFGFSERVGRMRHLPCFLLVTAACSIVVAAARAEDKGNSIVARTAAWTNMYKGADSDQLPTPPADTNLYTGETMPYISDEGPWEPGLGWDCGESCPPSWRIRAEWLEFTRNNQGDSLTRVFPFNDFQYTEGVRFTLDGRWDCTHGWELVYAGQLDWQQETIATGQGTLNADFADSNAVDLSAFFEADLQHQIYKSRLESVESAYKCWGWDVIAVGCGGRYIFLDEQLLFVSSGSNGLGLIEVNTTNNLVLGQVTLDMFYPINRCSFDATWKIGLGANVGDSDTLVTNNSSVQVNRRDQDIEFAALIEGGTYLRHFVTNRLTVRVGYELWYLYGVGLASQQILNQTVDNNTGRDFRGQQELLIHGGSLGLEYIW